MGASPFLSVPVEVLYRIFQDCDAFADLVVLARTCKAVHEVWLSHAPGLLWELAPTSMLAFNSALMAVSDLASAVPVYVRSESQITIRVC
jgi:hypothetical protein